MKIINSKDFDSYWKAQSIIEDDSATESAVKDIIKNVLNNGDKAIREYAAKFDKSSPQNLEVPFNQAQKAYEEMRSSNPELVRALELAAQNTAIFSKKQKEQFSDFEMETQPGVICGQKIIPVRCAAVYVPAGRFPLISSVLMTLIPAFTAGVEDVYFTSPPQEDGLPDKKIMATAFIAAQTCKIKKENFRIFAIGGAQAIAAFAFGTESVPCADVIAGPGNKYVAAAKKQLYGQVGIDFIAGPSDVLVIALRRGDEPLVRKAQIIAADLLAQAEHDPDARARALVPDKEFADAVLSAAEKQLKTLPAAQTARASLENGGLIIIYDTKEEAMRIANLIAPEHLELQIENPQEWIPGLKNYGSLFIGEKAAETLGDYSAGINHTLPTSGSARFTGGLSVRHFLKTVTTLRCAGGEGYEKVRNAAEIIAKAEGLDGHALSANIRINK